MVSSGHSDESLTVRLQATQVAWCHRLAPLPQSLECYQDNCVTLDQHVAVSFQISTRPCCTGDGLSARLELATFESIPKSGWSYSSLSKCDTLKSNICSSGGRSNMDGVMVVAPSDRNKLDQ